MPQVGGDAAKSCKIGQLLLHDHIVGLHQVVLQRTRNPVLQEAEVEAKIPCGGLFPLQIGIGQAVYHQVPVLEEFAGRIEVTMHFAAA
ncbi:hypothetical protein D3C73_770980 [compost metagenome]